MGKVPDFPLSQVLSDPTVAAFAPHTLGNLIAILGTLWAAGDMAIPPADSDAQRLARATDKQWARNRETVLAACRRLTPDLSIALAKSHRTYAAHRAASEIARSGKLNTKLAGRPVSRPSKSDTRTRRSSDGENGTGVRASGLAVVGGPALSRADVAAKAAIPPGTTLRD